jgi:hypothetical protein
MVDVSELECLTTGETRLVPPRNRRKLGRSYNRLNWEVDRRRAGGEGSLDVVERQRIVRLVVKNVVIGDDTLIIRHCIPIVMPSPSDGTPPAPARCDERQISPNYLLRKGRGSPLLSNLYLDEVDKMLERAKESARQGQYTYVEYTRYADDDRRL